MRKPYPTDLSDAEWTRLQSYLPSLKAESRLRTHSLRDVLDAIFYIVRSGCAWRLLPHDFPPWSTVYYHFRRFRLSGLWSLILKVVRADERKRVGRSPTNSGQHRFPECQNRRRICPPKWLRRPQERQGPEATSAGGHLGSTAFDPCHPRRRTGPGRSAPLTRWAGTAGAPPEEDLGRRRVQRQGTGQVVRGAGRVGARGRRARQGGQGL